MLNNITGVQSAFQICRLIYLYYNSWPLHLYIHINFGLQNPSNKCVSLVWETYTSYLRTYVISCAWVCSYMYKLMAKLGYPFLQEAVKVIFYRSEDSYGGCLQILCDSSSDCIWHCHAIIGSRCSAVSYACSNI